MKTCPHCLITDIPDAATHCRHCGKKLAPTHAAGPVVLILILIAAIIIILAWWLPDSNSKDAARSQAHIEIDSLKAVRCTPDEAEAFDDINTRRFKDELDRSPLDLEEKEMLAAQFANGMELAGCGFYFQNQLRQHPAHHKSK